MENIEYRIMNKGIEKIRVIRNYREYFLATYIKESSQLTLHGIDVFSINCEVIFLALYNNKETSE